MKFTPAPSIRGLSSNWKQLGYNTQTNYTTKGVRYRLLIYLGTFADDYKYDFVICRLWHLILTPVVLDDFCEIPYGSEFLAMNIRTDLVALPFQLQHMWVLVDPWLGKGFKIGCCGSKSPEPMPGRRQEGKLGWALGSPSPACCRRCWKQPLQESQDETEDDEDWVRDCDPLSARWNT